MSCQVSKKYERAEAAYRFGLHRRTKEASEQHANAFCAFGLSSPQRVVVIPFSFLSRHLSDCPTSVDKKKQIIRWRVRFHQKGKDVHLLTHNDQKKTCVTEFLLDATSAADAAAE